MHISLSSTPDGSSRGERASSFFFEQCAVNPRQTYRLSISFLVSSLSTVKSRLQTPLSPFLHESRVTRDESLTPLKCADPHNTTVSVDIMPPKGRPTKHVIPNPRGFCGVRDLLFGLRDIRGGDFNRPSTPLTPLECAVARFFCVSPLECALPKIRSSKCFGMRTYKKRPGDTPGYG